MNYLASEYFEKLAAPPSHFGVSPTGHSTAQLRAFLSGYTPNKGVMLGRLGLAGAAMAIPHGEMVAAPLLVGASGVNAVRNTIEMNKQIARGKRVFGAPVAAAQAPAPAMPAAEQPMQAPEKAAAMTMISFPLGCNDKIAGALGGLAGGLLGMGAGAVGGGMLGEHVGEHMLHDPTPGAHDASGLAGGAAGVLAGVPAGALAGGIGGAYLGDALGGRRKAAALEYFKSI